MPQINFRVDRETWFYLHNRDNYSIYIRDLIAQDRERTGDQNFIDLRLDKLKKEILGLEEIKKISTVKTTNKHRIIEEAGSVFKDTGRKELPDAQNIRWIQSRVMPKLKEEGVKIDSNELLEIFKNY